MGADVDIFLSRGALVPLVAMIAGIEGKEANWAGECEWGE